MIVLAQLSDTHLDLSDRNEERTTRVMSYLNDLSGSLDAVLVTGDLADHGEPAEYEQVAKLLTSPYPVFTCPGNHDDRAAYRKVLLDEAPSMEPINRLHVTANVAYLMCDSTIPGKDEGYLADETLAWMDDTLAALPRGLPALLCFHHSPAELHMPLTDGMRQFGADRLASLMARHPGIAAVLCGHSHTGAATTFAGRPLIVSPGVVSTLTLPWEHGGPVNFELPPAVMFHILDDNHRLTTHYRVVP
jgi:3',5'-cyclic-AMP phosphodiesterase